MEVGEWYEAEQLCVHIINAIDRRKLVQLGKLDI